MIDVLRERLGDDGMAVFRASIGYPYGLAVAWLGDAETVVSPALTVGEHVARLELVNADGDRLAWDERWIA